jgi:hypothetical protein
MKTKYLQTNPDTGQTEAFVALSNQEIIFLKEVVRMYDQKRLGDYDDKNIITLKKDLIEELHQAWRSMNPS